MSSEDSKTTRNTLITVAWIGFGGTVLAALIGLIATRGGSGGSSGGESPTASSPLSVPASTPATNGVPVSPSSIAPAPSGSVTVVWHHKVRFPSETGLDLNDDQPNIVDISRTPDFGTVPESDFPRFNLDGGRAASVIAKPDPTFNDCQDSFISQGQTGFFEVRVGQTACFQSGDGTRIAAVTVLSWDKQLWSLDADVTVWQATGSG
jgi:hypothetical protein